MTDLQQETDIFYEVMRLRANPAMEAAKYHIDSTNSLKKAWYKILAVAITILVMVIIHQAIEINELTHKIAIQKVKSR